MNIGALQRFSLIEYPGRICAIVFTQGCNFRCPYCYNRELVDPDLFQPTLLENDIISFLEKRRGKLDGVTLTGGEPTLQPGLIPFIERLKGMGYLVKIDSNGSRPDVLEDLVRSRLVDYIAMDIKGPLDKYPSITRSAVAPDIVKASIDLIMSSPVDYEFRTTVISSLLSRDDLIRIAQLISGARCYALQRFLSVKTLEPDFVKEMTYSDEEFSAFADDLRPWVKNVLLR